MSKVVKRVRKFLQRENNNYVAHVVRTNDGKYYYVDTADTFDIGPETMVFRFDEKKDVVASFTELYAERYATMEEAYAKHEQIIDNLESYL